MRLFRGMGLPQRVMRWGAGDLRPWVCEASGGRYRQTSTRVGYG